MKLVDAEKPFTCNMDLATVDRCFLSSQTIVLQTSTVRSDLKHEMILFLAFEGYHC